MQYTAFAVAIVLIKVYMRKRFRDFARISNLNHFFQFRPLLHIIVIVIDKNYIYMCRCLIYHHEANFNSIISCSEHKALGFLSFVQFIVLLNLIQALSKQLTGTEFIHAFRLQFSFDYFETGTQSNPCFAIERFTLDYFVLSSDYWYFKYITSIVYLFKQPFAGSWIATDVCHGVHKKIQLEDWRFVYRFSTSRYQS